MQIDGPYNEAFYEKLLDLSLEDDGTVAFALTKVLLSFLRLFGLSVLFNTSVSLKGWIMHGGSTAALSGSAQLKFFIVSGCIFIAQAVKNKLVAPVPERKIKLFIIGFLD